MDYFLIMVIAALVLFVIFLVACVIKAIQDSIYSKLENEVMEELGFSHQRNVPYHDTFVKVKSRQSLNNYTIVKYFKENREELEHAENVIQRKRETAQVLKKFLKENTYKSRAMYSRLESKLERLIKNAQAYRIKITYISSAGNNLGERTLSVKQHNIDEFKKDPSLLMGKGEYSKYVKEQQKIALSQKSHEYYERVNKAIDFANENRERLVIRGSVDQLDNLVAQLIDRTVGGIKKIKTVDSEEWHIVEHLMTSICADIEKVVNNNRKILDYYNSSDFLKIKNTCEALMSTQREFNEYISEKVRAVSQLFGVRVVRAETVNEDEYEYIRPYKKTVSPFTAEVSASVFASAENTPLEYVLKNFYPDKSMYPEQIQKLHLLIEELETLKEAKRIIENYKAEYRQYLGDVPDYVMEGDESGFYSRLGFANIDEGTLAVEYRFSYTSNGGKAKRSFAVPMTEETIVSLIKMLENKLTISVFTKEQRALMTTKLREHIKNRDNFTCCNCGNSVHKEPNLLLEIDHIVPVSKGGYTEERNLQTLCWKCNRAKSNKM